jgi:hypothetical protein
MSSLSLTSMNCDEVRDELSAYALGILEPDEHRAIEHHLESCAECRAALRPFVHVVDALAFAPDAAPPRNEVRARLLAAVQTPVPASTPPVTAMATDAPRDRSVLVMPRWAVWPAAAAAVLLIAGVAILAVLFAQARNERNDARSAERVLAAYLSAGGQITKLSVPPASDNGTYFGHGSLVTAPERPPIIVVGGCKPSGENRSYRVWVARGEDRTRVGELKVGKNGDGWLEVNVGEPLNEYDTVGITMVTGDQRQDVLVAPLSTTMTGSVV